MAFHLANPPENFVPPQSPLSSPFKLSTSPGTDIWRKPPSHDAFSAPILYRELPLSSLKRARVTISAPWRTLYDQGGLCLILPQRNGEQKWVKTGIEFTEGAPHISTVACDRWADWSLLPLEGEEVTVEIEREFKNGAGTSTLWIYAVGTDGRRNPIREVTWVFEGVGQKPQSEPDKSCWVGVYVAKPTKDKEDETRGLRVDFRDFAIETT